MKLKTMALAAVTVLFGALGGLAIGSPAAAVTKCQSYAHLWNYSGYLAEVPAISYEGSTACAMWRGMGIYDSVRVLQTTLNDCYLAPAGKTLLVVDGDFGGLTENALRYAQGVEGAAVDGQYGPETRRKLKWTSHFGIAGCARVPV